MKQNIWHSKIHVLNILFLVTISLFLISCGDSGSSGDETATCYGVSADDSSVCSGDGTCSAIDTCTCDIGFTGSLCASVAHTCDSIYANDPAVCSGHGTCVSTNTCTCDIDYSGVYCGTGP